MKLLPKQLELLRMGNAEEVGMACGLGYGKTFGASVWALQRAIKYGENCLAAAQTFSATESVIFKQMRAILDSWDMEYSYTGSSGKLQITLPGGVWIRGSSSQAPNAVTGLTNCSNLVTDESAIFDNDARLYLMGRCRGVTPKGEPIEPKYRWIGTAPLDGDTQWYREMHDKGECPFITAATVEAVGKTLTEKYYQSQVKAYGGLDSPLCRIQLFAEFLEHGNACQVLPTSIVSHNMIGVPGVVRMGVDCAGSGRDFTVFIVTDGARILEKVKMAKGTTLEMRDTAVRLIEKWGVKDTVIDVTGGFGNGLYDLLDAAGYMVRGVNFGQKAVNDAVYMNARAEMFFNLADKFKLGLHAADDEIRQEAKLVSFFINASGKTGIIPKEQIKKLLGRSPDSLDALALAVYDLEPPSLPKATKAEVDALMAAF